MGKNFFKSHIFNLVIYLIKTSSAPADITVFLSQSTNHIYLLTKTRKSVGIVSVYFGVASLFSQIFYNRVSISWIKEAEFFTPLIEKFDFQTHCDWRWNWHFLIGYFNVRKLTNVSNLVAKSTSWKSNSSEGWFIQRGSSARSSKLETVQACRDTRRPLVGSLRLCLHLWCVMSLPAFLQSAQINIHATNMPYPLLMNGRGGERVRECKEGGGGGIIISPPSVNKPTPHYQCMREGCGGRRRWRQYALTYTVITLN